jgi:AcrR family transcriptional regulator
VLVKLPVTRRERVRAATIAEIHSVARRLLVVQNVEAVTLRAIAREMGMTAPALYRYYDSRDALVSGMIHELLEELADHLEAARDAVPSSDLPARLLAMSRAMRSWALAHPREFELVFTTSTTPAAVAVAVAVPTPGHQGDAIADMADAGPRFAAVFLELFATMIEAGLIRVPPPSEVSPEVARQLAKAKGGALTAILSLGGAYLFVMSWTRLYGQICMEVFGQLDWCMDDLEPVFEATLAELAELLGFSDRVGELLPRTGSALDRAPGKHSPADHEP